MFAHSLPFCLPSPLARLVLCVGVGLGTEMYVGTEETGKLGVEGADVGIK